MTRVLQSSAGQGHRPPLPPPGLPWDSQVRRFQAPRAGSSGGLTCFQLTLGPARVNPRHQLLPLPDNIARAGSANRNSEAF